LGPPLGVEPSTLRFACSGPDGAAILLAGEFYLSADVCCAAFGFSNVSGAPQNAHVSQAAGQSFPTFAPQSHFGFEHHACLM
jgi:hypothetical protein